MRRLDLVLYNTLGKREERFEPIDPPRVRMYNCGPTVYNYAHIGNLSAYVFSDILRRTLEFAGYEVTQVVNITDVGHLTQDDIADAQGEDKLDLAARREKKSPWDLARHYTQTFFADMEALNIRAAHYQPRATEFIPEMIEMVKALEAKGLAYRAGSDVYFDVTKFKDYGRLSGNTLEALEAGARIEVREEKRSPHDFALWKSDPKHIMQWPSPWGAGFPGWHIECSAMAKRFLGETIDIHTGGEDHIFPHHECEIAQSEGANGRPFSRFWMHKRFILVDGKKMAKSAGNFYTLADLVKRGFTGRDLRYFFVQTHYRAQANFTWEGLEAARSALARLDNFVEKVERESHEPPPSPSGRRRPLDETIRADLGHLARASAKFEGAVAADLNMSGAIGVLMDLVREGNKRTFTPAEARETLDFLREVDEVLGVLFFKAPQPAVAQGCSEAEAQALLAQRDAARAARNFAEADRLRDELKSKGWAIEDSPAGSRLKRA